MNATGLALGAAKPTNAAASAKVNRAAAQFEAVLLNNVLSAVERAFTDLPGGHKDHSTEAYSGLAMQTLTTSLADHGGIGLGKLIAAALARRQSQPPDK